MLSLIVHQPFISSLQQQHGISWRPCAGLFFVWNLTKAAQRIAFHAEKIKSLKNQWFYKTYKNKIFEKPYITKKFKFSGQKPKELLLCYFSFHKFVDDIVYCGKVQDN